MKHSVYTCFTRGYMHNVCGLALLSFSMCIPFHSGPVVFNDWRIYQRYTDIDNFSIECWRLLLFWLLLLF